MGRFVSAVLFDGLTAIRAVLFSGLGLVWSVLVLATVSSFGVFSDGGISASVCLLLVAFAKIHLIGMHFMELREAPRALRWTFDAWVVMVCGVLIGLLTVTV